MMYFLDKKFPPDHSFVDGIIENEEKNDLILFCEFTKGRKIIESYKGVKVFNALVPRVGLFRIISFFYTPILMAIFIMCGERRVFIRNDPILLFAACIVKKIFRITFLVYQNSFPHDNYNPKSIKSFISSIILKNCINSIDKVIVVSELAEKRVEKLYRGPIKIIPLCVSSDIIGLGRQHQVILKETNVIDVVYVGSHDKDRDLPYIINSVLSNINIHLHLYGGSIDDEMLIFEKIEKEKQDRVHFYGRLNRDILFKTIIHFDYGLCLIPPKPFFLEASPTKLTEYLALGIPVIINDEIDSHKMFKNIPGSICCKFEDDSIKDTLENISNDTRRINHTEIIDFIDEKYNYKNFILDIWR